MTQPRAIDREEHNVPPYTVPDVLTTVDGVQVTTADQWQRLRRPEIVSLFQQHVYGIVPDAAVRVAHTVLAEDSALADTASRRQIRITLTTAARSTSMDCLLYMPKGKQAHGFPLFLGLNFSGNHTVSSESDIPITDRWVRNQPEIGTLGNRASEAGRGVMASRWPLQRIIGAGCAVATIYCGDLAPDDPEHWLDGVRQLFRDSQTPRTPGEAGAIGYWAWGLSRAVDCLEAEPGIDPQRIIVIGHSRLGKTALWAGALDQRFAMVISNNSGCGGAALSRRRVGETVAAINRQFPHWFCERFRAYDDNEAKLPVDQHMLLSLAAPRPLYVASAEEDLWADPRGEFVSTKLAEPVYALFGLRGLSHRDVPNAEVPDNAGDVAYHVRMGPHGITDYDWQQYLAFANRHFRQR